MFMNLLYYVVFRDIAIVPHSISQTGDKKQIVFCTTATAGPHPVGTWGNIHAQVESQNCTICPAGTKSSAQAGMCIQCPLGKVSGLHCNC